LFGGQDRDRQGIVPGARDLQHEGGGRNLVLHGLANAVAIGRAGKTLRLQVVSVLDQIDPGARRQADGVEAGLRRGLETRKAGKGAVLRCAPGRARQLRLGRCDQRERHSGRGNGEFGAGGELHAIRRGQGGALMLDRPFELVAAARLFRGICGSGREQQAGREQSVAHDDQSTAIMTSEAFTTTVTWPLALMPSSSTASLVIEDVMIWPLPMSTRTCEVVAPFLTSTTVPLSWLRALMRIINPSIDVSVWRRAKTTRR